METFERKLSEVFDYNRFELHPEMQELISDFEKRYLAKNRENNKRESISFKELEGQDRTPERVTKPSSDQLTKEKDKGKPR